MGWERTEEREREKKREKGEGERGSMTQRALSSRGQKDPSLLRDPKEETSCIELSVKIGTQLVL